MAPCVEDGAKEMSQTELEGDRLPPRRAGVGISGTAGMMDKRLDNTKLCFLTYGNHQALFIIIYNCHLSYFKEWTLLISSLEYPDSDFCLLFILVLV